MDPKLGRGAGRIDLPAIDADVYDSSSDICISSSRCFCWRNMHDQERVRRAVRRHILGEAGEMGGATPKPLPDDVVARLRASPRANPLAA